MSMTMSFTSWDTGPNYGDVYPTNEQGFNKQSGTFAGLFPPVSLSHTWAHVSAD